MNLTYPCKRYGTDTKLMITALLTDGIEQTYSPPNWSLTGGGLITLVTVHAGTICTKLISNQNSSF